MREGAIITEPSATPVIHALRNIGYNSQTAIADLVDNSIDANAENIYINFKYSEGNGYIKIEDDGHGMTEEELQIAMTIGSKDPRLSRQEKELGRFGMGLKTASFSLGLRLTVITKKAGIQSQRCWDLEYVSDTGKWLLKTDVPADVMPNIGTINGEQGTVVFIDKLDRFSRANSDKVLKEPSYYAKVNRIKEYLELVFHNLIEKGTSIYINDNELKAWDPFLSDNMYVIEGEAQRIRLNHTMVKVTPYILPHPSKFQNKRAYRAAGGIKGWYDQQGFYIYRENRLVNYGHWFNMFTKDQASELVRIKVEFSNKADEEWKLDIKKSNVSLPDELQLPLKSIAKQYRQQSREITLYRTTAKISGKSAHGSLKTWQLETDDSDSKYILNRTHPFLTKILREMNDDLKKDFNMYLKLIEMGSPANIMKPEQLVPDATVNEKVSEDEINNILQCANMLIESNIQADNFVELVVGLGNLEHIPLPTIEKILKEHSLC